MENDFTKPSVMKTSPTMDMGIIDSSNEKRPDEIVNDILSELDPSKVKLSSEEKEEYDNLETDEDRKEFLRLKSKSVVYNGMYDSLTEIAENSKKEEEFNRLDITPEDIERMLSPMTKEDIAKENDATYTQTLNKLFGIIRESYVKKRNRFIDGILDISIDMEELGIIRRLLNGYLKDHPEFINKLQSSFKIRESEAFFNDYTIESRMRYELNKEIACNVYGITPESYDIFKAEVLKLQSEYLKTVGVDRPTDLQKVWDEHALKCKHLLVKDPEAKEKLARGERIYESLFLATADRAYKDEVRESLQSSKDPHMKELFLEMCNNLYNDPISYKEKHKDKNKIVSRSLNQKSDVESFMDKMKKAKKSEKTSKMPNLASSADNPTQNEKNSNIEHSRGVSEGVGDTSEDLESFINDENKSTDKAEEKIVETKAKEVKNELEDFMDSKTEELGKPELQKLPKEGHKNELDDFIDKDYKEDEENVEEKSALEILLDKTDEDIQTARELGSKPKLLREDKSNIFDATFDLLNKEPDPSILRSNISTHEKMRKYKESSKYGRKIFLPNSRYSVTVCRIVSDTQISYTLRLLQNRNDIDSDLTVKFELIKVLYESLEFEDFDSRPSFNMFLQNTHESDLTLLFEMLALVNTPEVDGKVPLEITYLVCERCGNIAHLKKPLELDIKSEFVRLYPIATYAEKYNKYLTSGYTTIQQAYRKGSDVGKPRLYKSEDELFVYSVIYSLPTLYKKYITDSEAQSVAYQVARETLDTQLEDSDSLGPKVQEEMVKIQRYAADNSYASISERYTELVMMGITDVNPDVLEGEDLDKYNEFKDELDILNSLNNMIYNISNTLRPIFTLCNFIDRVSIKTKDGIDVSSKIEHDNLYELAQVLTNLPEHVLKELSEIVLSQIEEDKKYIIDADITIDSSELKGNIEWENVYQYDSETNSVISEESLEEKWIANKVKNNEEVTDEDVESRRKVRELMKERTMSGLCTCGSEKFKVNYTNLLFFSISKK